MSATSCVCRQRQRPPRRNPASNERCSVLNATVDYEVEYNNRARVPEYPALFAGWAKDAAAYRERYAPRSVAYGPGARNVIDFFPGDGEGPIVVFIHGGYWQSLGGSSFSHLAGGLNAHALRVAISRHDPCPP